MTAGEFMTLLKRADSVYVLEEGGTNMTRFTPVDMRVLINAVGTELLEPLVERDTNQQAIKVAGKWHCVTCGKKVKRNFCPYCGQRQGY